MGFAHEQSYFDQSPMSKRFFNSLNSFCRQSLGFQLIYSMWTEVSLIADVSERNSDGISLQPQGEEDCLYFFQHTVLEIFSICHMNNKWIVFILNR